jgi:hypothetical protein
MIITNLVPIYGVLFLGWQVNDIILIYWFETGIVGLFNIPKILRSTVNMSVGHTIDKKINIYFGGFGAILFFLAHYGGFWFVHSIILSEAMNIDPFSIAANFQTYKWSIISITAGYLISYKLDFLDLRKYERKPGYFMLPPYGRVAILHMTVLLGGSVGAFLDNPTPILFIMVVMRMIADWASRYFNKEIEEILISEGGSIGTRRRR